MEFTFALMLRQKYWGNHRNLFWSFWKEISSKKNEETEDSENMIAH